MRHFRAASRLRQDVIERVASDAYRAHPHRRAIAPAPVWLAPALPGPLDERPAVAGVRVGMEVGVKQIDVADGRASEPRYVRKPFDCEPDSGAVSVNYALRELIARSSRGC